MTNKTYVTVTVVTVPNHTQTYDQSACTGANYIFILAKCLAKENLRPSHITHKIGKRYLKTVEKIDES